MRILLALTIALLASSCNAYRDQHKFAKLDATPPKAVVQLRVGEVPSYTSVALHSWFAGYDPATKKWHRWDVTAVRDPEGNHLRKDHMGPGEWTRVNWIHAEWAGERAQLLIDVLNRPQDYPHGESYGSVMGPNENSYARWIVREAGASCDLPPRATGKDYIHWLAGAAVTTTRTGLQFDTQPFGFAFGLLDGVEIHLFGTTFGFDLMPPALLSPFGRFGLPG